MKKNTLTYLFSLFVILLTSSEIYAQRSNSSDIVCLEILDNNRVHIKWTKSITDLFDSYTLYFSNDGSSFDSIANFPDADSVNFIHVGINALLAKKYYYLQVNGGANPDISPVASTLFIGLVVDQTNFYQADLFWSPFSDPLSSQMDSYYKIYMDYPDGFWHEIGSTDQTEFRKLEVITCNDSVNFVVTIDDGDATNHCVSNSQIVGDWFKDIIYPKKPVLDSVSVTPDGHTVIGWTQSDSLDAVGNIIYKHEGIKWNPVDSVFGYNTQVYLDSITDPCSENFQYAISSFDSCGNNSPFTDQTAQRPIFLYEIPYSVCDLKDTLRWTVYINPKNPIDTYEIWSSKNGGPYSIIGEQPPTAAENGEIIFVHDNLDPGAIYEYFIRVKMGDITSSSCRKSVQTYSYKIPQFVNTTTADVLSDNTVNVTVEADLDIYKCIWDIWRYGSGQADTTHIEQITKPDQNSSPFFIPDGEVDASTNPWFYYTTVIDSCGKKRLTSNSFKTIWLQGFTQDNINHLQWTAVEGWDEGVEKYYIFRTVPDVEPTTPIDSVAGNILEYQQPAPTSGIEDGRAIYFVQGLKKSTAGEHVTSKSNRIPLYKEASIHFANAFRPEGEYREYKPVFSFFGGNSYLFQIYNRWGKLIFETQDPNEGWDGTYQGKLAEQSAYIYVVSYHSVNGSEITKKGTVMLVR